MSNTVATKQASPSRAMNIALWVLQAVLAFQFAGGGLLKLSGSPEMVDLFATIGVGPWLPYLVGTLELAGAAGLLIPRLSGLAALGLAGLMVGAAATNLFILAASPWLPIGFAGSQRSDRLGSLVANQGPGRLAPPLTPGELVSKEESR
jgi:uncharacterized membrane protein YphA (DoxX/SURF4 family)